MNTTVRIKASEIYKDWHVIDAAGRPLGRVASEAAILLRGKHKPTYEPHLDDGDFVIVINAAQVKITGRKREQNRYYTHSGYPGGLKTRTFTEQQDRFPDRIIEKAVWGMLPGGTLGESMQKHLKVYRGPNHPHQSQITGSERAQAARADGSTTLVWAPPRLGRLRGVHADIELTLFEDEPIAVAPLPEALAAIEPAVAEAAEEATADAAEDEE
jgi:large subunit ribosomal protein L13